MSFWDLANSNLKHLVPYEPGKPVEDVARELELDPASIIKLASNENPIGPSPKAVEAILQNAPKANIYPDGSGFHLRNAIAQKMGVDRGQVVLGNGSNEIIEFVYRAFAIPGKTGVVASAYAFVVYKLMAELFGVEFVEAPSRNFGHDLNAMRKAIKPSTRLLFIANPNNPTGTLIPTAELESFIADTPDHVIIVLDEAYYEFLEEPPPSVEWIEKYKRLVLLRTFSKIQGLAGLRIGYGLTHPELGGILQRCRQPFNANAVAQAAALAGLLDQEHQDKTKQLTLQGRHRLENYCAAQKLEYIPSYANFVMLKVGDADAVFQSLLRKGVIVRSLKSYGLPEWIRISIGTRAQMDTLEQELNAVLKNT